MNIIKRRGENMHLNLFQIAKYQIWCILGLKRAQNNMYPTMHLIYRLFHQICDVLLE